MNALAPEEPVSLVARCRGFEKGSTMGLLEFFFRPLRRVVVDSKVARLAAALVDTPAKSFDEVVRRCRAADALAALGTEASAAIPALLRTLVVPVTVDCALALRVSAAAAIWKVSHQTTEAIPVLAWALKDEYWGLSPRAVEVLAEIGDCRVVPDLVWLADRLTNRGPLRFEIASRIGGLPEPEPLLAAVAVALGRCGLGKSDGESYAPEARAALAKMADSTDGRVRRAAQIALTGLGYVN